MPEPSRGPRMLAGIAAAAVALGVTELLAVASARWETRRVPVGSAAIVVAGIAGCAAVLSRAGATLVDVVPTVVGTAFGVAVLRLLTSGRFTDGPEQTEDPDFADRGRR